MIYVAECKGGAPTPPPPRKPPVPTDAGASGSTQAESLRRKSGRGFLSTILTGGGANENKSLLGL